MDYNNAERKKIGLKEIIVSNTTNDSTGYHSNTNYTNNSTSNNNKENSEENKLHQLSELLYDSILND